MYGCKKAISKSKSVILQKKISDCNGDQKKLFKIVDTLLGRNKEATLPKYDSPVTMATVMNTLFIAKIFNIRAEFPLLEANLPSYSFLSMHSIMSMCLTGLLGFFYPVTDMLKFFRPVSNLSFLSKVIEKVISISILGHILDNNIVDSFQSAYRAGHSCETALLCVYNYIVTTVGKGNGSFLVLLDLSTAFDTIDHDNLFYILEICRNWQYYTTANSVIFL